MSEPVCEFWHGTGSPGLMSTWCGPGQPELRTGGGALTGRQEVFGPPRISTWNWPAAMGSAAVLARLRPDVLSPHPNRYLRARTRPAQAWRPQLWLGARNRDADRRRDLPDDRPPWPPMRRGRLSAPVPAPLQPHLAGPRRPRGRPDETQRLGLPPEAHPLRRQRPQRPRPQRLRPHHDRHLTLRLCQPPGRPAKIPKMRVPGPPHKNPTFQDRGSLAGE